MKEVTGMHIFSLKGLPTKVKVAGRRKP